VQLRKKNKKLLVDGHRVSHVPHGPTPPLPAGRRIAWASRVAWLARGLSGLGVLGHGLQDCPLLLARERGPFAFGPFGLRLPNEVDVTAVDIVMTVHGAACSFQRFSLTNNLTCAAIVNQKHMRTLQGVIACRHV